MVNPTQKKKQKNVTIENTYRNISYNQQNVFFFFTKKADVKAYTV